MERGFARLVEEIRSCKRCALPKGSYPVFAPVFPARFLLIGQAPGKEETEKGVPFIGQAGRRLFAWIERTGIKEEDFRKRVYITQVAKCFPGKGERGDLKPSKEILLNCLPYLREEIIRLDPDVIIPVGSLAIAQILGRRRLAGVIGEKIERELLGRKRIIIPLPHPSGLSVWSYKKENLLLIKKALRVLKDTLSLSWSA